jgi:hypothetical protein
MKLQSALSVALFAAVAALSLGAQAADVDKTQATAGGKTEQGTKAANAAEEKTGTQQKAPSAKPATSAKATKGHDHGKFHKGQ